MLYESLESLGKLGKGQALLCISKRFLQLSDSQLGVMRHPTTPPRGTYQCLKIFGVIITGEMQLPSRGQGP